VVAIAGTDPESNTLNLENLILRIDPPDQSA
jgi:hypothetical protein